MAEDMLATKKVALLTAKHVLNVRNSIILKPSAILVISSVQFRASSKSSDNRRCTKPVVAVLDVSRSSSDREVYTVTTFEESVLANYYGHHAERIADGQRNVSVCIAAGEIFQALADTGASCSVISSNDFAKLKCQMRPMSSTIQGFGQKAIHPLGLRTLKVKCQ